MMPYGEFWVALALILLIFWNLPAGIPRRAFLAAASFVYLATLDWRSTVQLLVLAILFYFVAPRPQAPLARARVVLTLLIFGILGYLAYFKYMPRLFAVVSPGRMVETVAIPLGISYFTFKLIHYAAERRRGTFGAHGFIDFLDYLFLFPIYTAGPIERFDHFLSHRANAWEWRFAVEGLWRIIHGLIKQLALVEYVLPALFGDLPAISALLGGLEQFHPWQIWRFVILTYLYAYLDFSAYTDLAIGSSRLFGIEIMENFNFPIFAQNITEFWQRWHMTLAGWCQSYIYMPLIGLTRSPYLAVYATFITIGLWHAGTWQWLAWGAYHATGVAAYVTWRRSKTRRNLIARWPRMLRVLGYPLTFLFVAAGYSLTCTHDQGTIYDSLRILVKLFGIDLPAVDSAA